jgi:hypothetical protein
VEVGLYEKMGGSLGRNIMHAVLVAMGFVCFAAAGTADQDAAPVRVWHDASGKYEVRESLVEAKYNKEATDVLVTLRKEDGTTVSVPLKKLSEEDQRFVKRTMQTREPDEATPKKSGVNMPEKGRAKKTRPAVGGKKATEAAETQIEKALAEKTDMQFVDTPLTKVVEYLKDKHKIEIQLDRKALEEVGAKLRSTHKHQGPPGATAANKSAETLVPFDWLCRGEITLVRRRNEPFIVESVWGHAVIALAAWMAAATKIYGPRAAGNAPFSLEALTIGSYRLLLVQFPVAIGLMIASLWKGREWLYLALADTALCILQFASGVPEIL